MVTTARSITVDEFHSRYANEKGYEYWFGEVVKKSVPTWIHSILQVLLGEIFYELGYFSGSELDLRISREFQPRPDIAASLELEPGAYPTKPIDIVAEIVSPDDAGDKVVEKCRNYGALGIRQIYVFDPEARIVLQWNKDSAGLERIQELALTNGETISVRSIFARLDERLKSRR